MKYLPLILASSITLLAFFSLYFLIPAALSVLFFGLKLYIEETASKEIIKNIFLDSKYLHLENDVLNEISRLKRNCHSFGYDQLQLYPTYITFNKGIIKFGNRKLSGTTNSSDFRKMYVNVALYKKEGTEFVYDEKMKLSDSALVHELAHVILGRRIQMWGDYIHHQIMSDEKLDL